MKYHKQGWHVPIRATPAHLPSRRCTKEIILTIFEHWKSMGTPEEFLRKLPDAPRDDQAQTLKLGVLRVSIFGVKDLSKSNIKMNQVTKHAKREFSTNSEVCQKTGSQVHMAHQRLLELRAVVKDPHQGMPKLTVPRSFLRWTSVKLSVFNWVDFKLC